MKQVNDMSNCSGATAIALLFEGKPAGRIIANWSNNPSGSVCSASVIIWEGPLKDCKGPKGKELNYANIGKASGYGYDKLSQSVWQCLNNAGVQTLKVEPGNGQTTQEFEAWGYQAFTIL
jgi:hypothetical protein